MPLTKLIQLMTEKIGEDVLTEEVVEDFKGQVDSLIQEQVDQKVDVLKEELETELKEKYRDDAEKFKTDLIENIDAYMDYAAKEFLKENEVAIESEYKVKAADELIEAFAEILEGNFFKVDPAKNKSLKALEERISKKNKALNESEKKNIELSKQLFEYEKAIEFKEMTEGISKNKSEKVLELLEGLDFENLDEFKKKVEIVIEQVSAQKSEKKEELKEEKEEKVSSIDKYLK